MKQSPSKTEPTGVQIVQTGVDVKPPITEIMPTKLGVVQVTTRDAVENITELKASVLAEITQAGFPNLAFLYSDAVLAVIPDILNELLAEEKEQFHSLLMKPLEKITFVDIYRTGRLGYLFSLIQHLDKVRKSEVSEGIIQDFEPRYTEYSNEILFSKKFYELHLQVMREDSLLTADQKRVLEKEIQSFEMNGIHLSSDAQERIKCINVQISTLANNFRNNLVKSKKEFCYQITDVESIKDLPEETLRIAQSQAKRQGKEGYIFDASPTMCMDILSYCSNSKIREDFAKAMNSFASSGEFDNRPLILEILKLREEKARLLGHNNFAELSLIKKMAGSPEVVFGLLREITAKAKNKALVDVSELKSHFHLDTLEYWDVSFYQTKLKREKYSFDTKELKKYFEYENVVSYLFGFVQEFYGVEMRKIDVPSYSEDIGIYEVYRKGKLISYFLADPFYNGGKKAGAWADNFRGREYVDGVEKIPVVVNVCNFQKSESKQTLLTMGDVETLFHEFGHALHEMLSQSEYSHLSGFGVEWDFVELPSQLLENWVNERESLIKFAKHYQTGENIPISMLDTLDTLKTFMSGLQVLVQNMYALLDMELYSVVPPSSLEELDRKALSIVNAITLFPRGEEYKMHASFAHIFSGGYSAGYYSYMWAELLEADVFQEIKKRGMFDGDVGEDFIQAILGQGTRRPAKELFRDFMGRDVNPKAFMERKGLLV